MGFQKIQTVKDMPTWTNNDYTKEWKEIEKLENEGLPKSALEKVNLIYQKAKADDNTPQIVKSLIHRVKYTSQLEEDGMVVAIADIQEEGPEAQERRMEIGRNGLEVYDELLAYGLTRPDG